MAKISLVLPIYNVEAYLDRCLSSIRTQRRTDFVVLCVNDGSTDQSQSIIDHYVKLDQRFVSLTKSNGGLSDARNYGLERVTTPYVMFLDSDDFVEEDMLELALGKMEKDELDLLVFDYFQYFDEKNLKEEIHLPFEEDVIYNLKSHPQLLAYLNNAAWNKIYKTSLFKDHGIVYPFGYRHQDLGTTFRYLCFCERVGFIRKPLYDYLADRPNNLTQMIDPKIDHILDMVKMNLEFYQLEGLSDAYREELKYLGTINLLQSLRKLPKFEDQTFVFDFIDKSFDLMKAYFNDWPKSTYPIYKEAYAWLYLNRNLLKWYYRYTQLRKKA